MKILRSAEIDQLTKLILAGASASLIGISGSGKSNLFNHLLKIETRQRLFADKADNILFVRINFHFLDEQDVTLRNIFSLILEQIEIIAEQYAIDETILNQIGANHRALIDAENQDTAKLRYHFNQAIHRLMRRSKRQLVFLFDQFETVFQQGKPRIFLALRGLRENYKYRVSFLTFTRNTLPILADIDPAREEFYELLAPNWIGLKPYTKSEAAHMLNTVANRYQAELAKEVASSLYDLVGGHAGTLRAAYLAWSQGVVELEAGSLLAHENVLAELNKIWRSLSAPEQRVLHQIAHLQNTINLEQKQVRLLKLKGLITLDAHLAIPLLNLFLKGKQRPQVAPTHLDHATLRILINGQPTEQLSIQEYRIVNHLMNNIGTLVERDDLVNAGWPDSMGGVSNETINQAISRIRQKIRAVDASYHKLVTIRGKGYRLDP